VRRNWVFILFTTQCLLSASCAIGQGTDCKTDRAHFVARDDASIREEGGSQYKLHFDQIAGSLSQLFAEVTVKKLNAGATGSEIIGYLGCITKGEDVSTEMREAMTEFSNAPVVLIPPAADPPQAIVATYPLIGYPADGKWAIAPSRPIVQCFAKNGRGWSFVGELGGDYARSTFSIYPLTSPVPGQTWSLLAGRAIGDTGGRLLLEVVVCDGKSFTKKWTRRDIEWGKIESVDGNAVLLTYEKHLDEKGRVIHTEAGPIRYSEVLHVTPNGLE
jgi:hypothetical protein